MTEGRGWALGEEVGAEWESEDGRVLVIRPLGLALAKEVEYFLDRSGLEEVGWVDGEEGIERERLEGERDVKKKGIGRLTEGAFSLLSAREGEADPFFLCHGHNQILY